MSITREIVTIQAGNFANFIGSHWWNLQESAFSYDLSYMPEIDNEVLFREGENYRGEVTFTPRLVLIDLKDNIQSIRQECPLYRLADEDDYNPLWQGTLEVIQESPIRRNPFLEDEISTTTSFESDDYSDEFPQESYDFNSKTTVWSDFLKTNLHPRSFCLFQEMASDDTSPLEIYSSGDEVYKKSGKDMIEDCIRKMTEECDYMEGFQLIYDSHNGFSAITNHIMQHLNDEYSRHSTLCFPTFQSDKPPPYEEFKEQMHRLYAILLSLNGMTSYSSLFSPLSLSSDVVKFSEPFTKFPFLHYNGKKAFQTSAILAASIDSLTSQFRLKTQRFSFSDITSAMSSYSRKLICSSVCLPFPIFADGYLSTIVEKDVPDYYMTPISPFYDPKSEKTLFQSAILRGVPLQKFEKYNKPYTFDPEEQFAEYLNKYSPSSITTATTFSDKCCLTYPFPNIFKTSVGRNGFLLPEPDSNGQGDPASKRSKFFTSRRCHLTGVESFPAAASFSSSDSVARFVDNLLAEANKINFRDYVKRAEGSYEKDDFIEVLQNVIGLRDNYRDY